jgi:hypothetical protein
VKSSYSCYLPSGQGAPVAAKKAKKARKGNGKRRKSKTGSVDIKMGYSFYFWLSFN